MKSVDVPQHLLGRVLRPRDVVWRVAPARDPSDFVIAKRLFQAGNAAASGDARASSLVPQKQARGVCGRGRCDVGPERVGLERAREHETRGHVGCETDDDITSANQSRRA